MKYMEGAKKIKLVELNGKLLINCDIIQLPLGPCIKLLVSPQRSRDEKLTAVGGRIRNGLSASTRTACARVSRPSEVPADCSIKNQNVFIEMGGHITRRRGPECYWLSPRGWIGFLGRDIHRYLSSGEMPDLNAAPVP